VRHVNLETHRDWIDIGHSRVPLFENSIFASCKQGSTVLIKRNKLLIEETLENAIHTDPHSSPHTPLSTVVSIALPPAPLSTSHIATLLPEVEASNPEEVG
jgi:hypothetical protein